MLVDNNAARRRAVEDLTPATYFGQLQHIVVVRLPVAPALGLSQPTTFVLAGIQKCKTKAATRKLPMPTYAEMGGYEIVDIKCLQCLIGRVPFTNGKKWAILDRTDASHRSDYLVENDT